MISKELLSEVLNRDLPYIETRDNVVYFEDFGSMTGVLTKHINIYELAHKCKEWANKHKLTNPIVVDKQLKLYSYVDRFGGHCRIKLFPAQSDATDKLFSELTEPEAVFKACEWILKKKLGEQNED